MAKALEPVFVTSRRPRDPRGVVLVLHGGRSTSEQPVHPAQLAVLRMLPVGRHVARRLPDVAVWWVRNRLRGWNGPDAAPVRDAEAALGEVAQRHGDIPVVLVGHSMGGRAALRVAGYPSVRAVVALAPWLPDAEPVAQLAGRRLAVLHGTRDRTTDPAASRRYAARAVGVAEEVGWLAVAGSGHAMLRHARTWHRLVGDYVAAVLAGEPVGAPFANPLVSPARPPGRHGEA